MWSFGNNKVSRMRVINLIFHFKGMVNTSANGKKQDITMILNMKVSSNCWRLL